MERAQKELGSCFTSILQIAHQTHLGQEMMVHQLCGKVFWADMNSDIRERVEVSHISMFDIWAGHTIHMDFCQYKNINNRVCINRLTGYIQVEKVPNQQTSSAILEVKKWAAKFGFPYKMIHNGMSVATNMILLNHMLLVVNWDIFQHVIDLIMSCCPKRHVTHI